MAKHVAMTRERKIALPLVLDAADSYLKSLPDSDKRREPLRKALEAFRGNQN